MKRTALLLLCLLATVLSFAQAKYIFYFIGDGMGTNQVLASEMYLAELEGRIGRKPLLMTQFPVGGSLHRRRNRSQKQRTGRGSKRHPGENSN